MRKKNEMRLRPMQFVPIILIFALAISAQPAIGGGEDALLGDVELKPVPFSQGEGGPIELDLAIPFYSGCCYPLYAYDVTANLNLPRNIEIISGPEPKKFSKIEAAAGGEPTWVHIKWTVKSLVAGEYKIDATVNTQNCGSSLGSTNIEVTKGCVISIPEIYPNQPSTQKNLYVNIEAMSPIDGVYIEDLTLYYASFNSEKANAKGENEILHLGKSNRVEGTPVKMEPIEDRENFFSVTIPKQGSTYFHFWVVATDNRGNRTTSPVYIEKIEDLEYVNFVTGLAVWIPIILTITGIISMTLLSRRLKSIDVKSQGLLVLGSNKISSEDASLNFRKHHKRKYDLALYTVFVILFSAGCVLLLWAILTNQLGDLIYTVGGGL